MTQNDFLIKHFRSGKTMTTLQAHRYGICRLSQRVIELEHLGHKIKHVPKRVRSRFGGKVRVIEYGF